MIIEFFLYKGYRFLYYSAYMNTNNSRSLIFPVLKSIFPRWLLRTSICNIPNHYMQKGDKQKESIDDDLEAFYRDLQHERISESSSHTYFLPKLTEKEQQLVDDNDLNYFKKKKIRRSKKSESMFIRGQAWRKTSIIDPSFAQNCCSIQ